LSRSSAIFNIFAFLDDQGSLFWLKLIPALHILYPGVTSSAMTTFNEERMVDTVVPIRALLYRGGGR
jgi:hypothetical protein